MKKTPSLIICILLLCCAAASHAVGVAEPTEQQPQQLTNTQQAAVRKLLQMYRDVLDRLPTVCDKASADATAEQIAAYQRLFPQLEPVLEQIDADYIQELMGNLQLGRDFAEKDVHRLLFADFYGSAALAKAILSNAAHSLPAQELPADILQQFADMAQTSLKNRPEWSNMVGPGFTRETAWVLRQMPDIGQTEFCSLFVRLIYSDSTPLDRAGLGTSVFYSEKLFADGKAYIHLCADVIPTERNAEIRYRLHQWFDISAIVPFRSEADVRQAAERLIGTIQQLTAVVEGVHDKATADAAADQIPPLRQLAQQQMNGLRWLNEAEFSRIVRENKLDLNALMSGFTQLEEADFHGSEKLRNELQRRE